VIMTEQQMQLNRINSAKSCNWPFEKGSYEYYFDKFFDIPEGIPEDMYTDLEADKFALKMIEDD